MTFPLPMKIVGVGRYLPRRIVTNEELEEVHGLPAGWIERKQGLQERRWAGEDEPASFMGAEAAREAVSDAGLSLSDIDLIINASATPEQAAPDGSALIQRALGLGQSGIAAMSVNNICLSFLTALDVATIYLATGRYHDILVVTADVTSALVDSKDVHTCTLLGDGAAAAVVTRTPEGESSSVHNSVLSSYGIAADLSGVAGLGTRKHPGRPSTVPGDHLFRMDGIKLMEMGFQYGEAFWHKLRPAGFDGYHDIDAFVLHQPSRYALETTVMMMGIPQQKVVKTLAKYGNCGAASIALTLYEAIRSGKVARGERMVLMGMAAGVHFGGMILTY